MVQDLLWLKCETYKIAWKGYDLGDRWCVSSVRHSGVAMAVGVGGREQESCIGEAPFTAVAVMLGTSQPASI
jgi:hypothetical protein